MGFDFIVIPPLLPSHWGFSFVFGCGVSFLVSSSVFLLMIVQQLVVILVPLTRGSWDLGTYNRMRPDWEPAGLMWPQNLGWA